MNTRKIFLKKENLVYNLVASFTIDNNDLFLLKDGLLTNVSVRVFEYEWQRIVGYADKLSYLPNPSARAGYDTRSIFKRSLTGFNSEFSFS